MLAIIETVAYLVFWLCIGCFTVWGALQVLDFAVRICSFTLVKVAIDRTAKYDTFKTCWDDVKRKH